MLNCLKIAFPLESNWVSAMNFSVLNRIVNPMKQSFELIAIFQLFQHCCLHHKTWKYKLWIVSTNQIWHMVQWWTGITLEWPEPYNTDNYHIWIFECAIFYFFLPLGNQKANQLQGVTSTLESIAWSTLFLAKAYFLNAYSSKWVQSCGSTSLPDNFNISNPILRTMMNRSNLRVASTLQHRQKSTLMVWNFNWRLSLGKVWCHKSSHMVDTGGSIEKLSAKAHNWI